MKRGIVCLLLVWLAPGCTTNSPTGPKTPVFAMTSIVLYQPNDVLVRRLGDASGLASYTQALVAVANKEFSSWPEQAPVQGSLVVAVKPSGAARVWVVYYDGSVEDAEESDLKQRLETVTPVVTVHEGPIALAINFTAWATQSSKFSQPPLPPIPDEWRAAIVGHVLVPDAVLATVWP